ncbi:cysteine desulfurase family protein [Actibacterium lipolyticum]|uniref:Cysteine desulfurase n=1 Tax=Actibacterium lipolyticum TaxID=1524263 RepID=A0A238JYN5_9RHOB|nr:cysteine desulfurase family protein [Actibacterium lipolyticum]SMX34816.1 Cysteine desulfurase [Actibacterium lipolyticum]
MARAYLDFNATAPVRPEAKAAMIAAMDLVGNPSSVHSEGRAAKAAVEKAREQVAIAVGCKPVEVIFTGGATEAAMVLDRLPGNPGVAVQGTAHDCLWAHRSDSADNASVYAMGLANSETGVIADVPRKVDGAWQVGTQSFEYLLLDVVQAIGRVPFAFGWSGADMALISAHKFGGPKGVGALILRQGIDTAPLTLGGGHEMGRRSGTENVVGIAGFGAAIEAAMSDLEQGKWARVEKLRDTLEAAIVAEAKDTIFVGKDARRLPNTACFAAPGWKGETQVMQLDLAGFAVSAGSACSSGKVKVSRVLQAMGYDDVTASSAIRVSLGPDTTEDEISRFTDAWLARHEKFRARAA